MTYPNITNSATGHSTSAQSSHTLPIPSGSGDLLLAYVSTPTAPSASGWTLIKSASYGASGLFLLGRTDPGGLGSTFSISVSSAYASWVVLRIANAAGVPEGEADIDAIGSGGESANPDPDQVTANNGTDDNLWLSAAGWASDVAHSGYTSGYSNNQLTDRYASGTGVAVCSKNSNVAVENPGSHTLASSTEWSAITCVVRSPETTNHDLVSNNVSAGNPVAGNADVSQVHVLVSDAVASGVAAVGNPVISQVHALAGNGTSSDYPSLGNPVATQNHSLAGGNVSSGSPSIANPTLAQVHVLSATELSSGSPAVSNSSVSQNHAINSIGVTAGIPVVGIPSIATDGYLLSDSVDSGSPSLSSPTIEQVHVISAESVASNSPTVFAPSLTLIHSLTGGSVSSGTPTAGNPTLLSDGYMAPDPVSSGSPSLGSSTISQVHALSSVSVATSASSVGSPQVFDGNLIGTNSVSSGIPSGSSPSISQVHVVTSLSLSTGDPTLSITSFVKQRGGGAKHNKCCCDGSSCLISQDDFDRVDSDSLGAGWTEISGDFDIVSNTFQTSTVGVVTTTARQGKPRGTTFNYIVTLELVLTGDVTSWGIICKFVNDTTFDWVELTKVEDLIYPKFYRRSGGADTLILDITTHPAGTPIPTFGLERVPIKMCYSEVQWSVIGHSNYLWTTCDAQVTSTLPANTNCGLVGFTKGRFDNWAYWYHELSKPGCDFCDCFCQNPNDPADWKCYPETLTLTLHPITNSNCTTEPDDIVIGLYQADADTSNAPDAPDFVLRPSKTVWRSDPIPSGDWSGFEEALWFKLECQPDLGMTLTILRYGSGETDEPASASTILVWNNGHFANPAYSIECSPIILRFLAAHVVFHSSIPPFDDPVFCDPFNADDYEVIITE